MNNDENGGAGVRFPRVFLTQTGDTKMKTALLFLLIVFMTGCADAPSFTKAASIDPVGFWYVAWDDFANRLGRFLVRF